MTKVLNSNPHTTQQCVTAINLHGIKLNLDEVKRQFLLSAYDHSIYSVEITVSSWCDKFGVPVDYSMAASQLLLGCWKDVIVLEQKEGAQQHCEKKLPRMGHGRNSTGPETGQMAEFVPLLKSSIIFKFNLKTYSSFHLRRKQYDSLEIILTFKSHSWVKRLNPLFTY